jgi:DNA-binding response OmpR family regulator
LRDVKILRLLQDRRGQVIEAEPSRPRIIRTVHGAGYRFDG